MVSEADVHFELYRYLKNSIVKNPEYHGLKFGDVIPEKGVQGVGNADIVVEDHKGHSFLVIEAKRRSEKGYDRNIDPYAPKVIQQASQYALTLGAKYFATYNRRQLALFQTFQEGVPLLQRRAGSYEVTDPEKFAPTLLEQVAGIEKGIIIREFEKIRKKGEIKSSSLNKAVLKPLGLKEQSEDISAYVEALSKARREGKEVGEMVAGIEEKAKPGELEGGQNH